MAFDDKFLGTIFPTREGVASGQSNERTMLDRIGGANQVRTKLRENNDGSITRLKTRFGMPEFVTEGGESGEENVSAGAAYLESGQLEWSYPAPLSPTRYDPALWHFIGGSSGRYLGKIEVSDGSSRNKGLLSEGMSSQAIGYPPSTDPVEDAASKELYGETTVMKKMVVGIFPASIFSGRLRQFIQAQYGAAESVSPPFPFYVDAVGTDPILVYSHGGTEIQFTHYPHDSVGLICTPSFDYWLVKIQLDGVPNFKVTVWPLTFTAVGKSIRRILKSSALTPTAKIKLESYLLAQATITTTAPRVIGTFSGGAHAIGWSMGYGWKFNSSGLKAAINSTIVLDVDVPDMERYSTARIDLTISATKNPVAVDGYDFSISSTATGATEWTDGWGEYNLWIPGGVLDPTLSLYSIAMDTSYVKPPFSFSNAEIYGYFVNDEWVPVTISRNVTSSDTEYAHEYSGMSFDPSFAFPPGVFWNTYGATQAGSPSFYKRTATQNGTTMDVSIGGWNYTGMQTFTSINSTTTTYDSKESPSGGVDYNFCYQARGLEYGQVIAEQPAGWSTFVSYGSHIDPVHGGPYPEYASFVERLHGVARVITEHYDVGNYKVWSLIIPRHDSEAAYVATQDRMGESHGKTVLTQLLNCDVGDAIYAYAQVPEMTFYLVTVTPWMPSKVAFYSSISDNTETSLVNLDFPIKVHCFNNKVSGVEGVPGDSYYAIFNASRFYPTYDRGMIMQTGLFNYVGSEGISSDPAIVLDRRFVGWA